MSRIAAILTDMFEDVEYTGPADAYREAGHEVVNIGLKAGETVHGKKKGTAVKIHRAVTDVAPGEFDALLIPGGFSPDKLRAHDEPVAFVKEFVETGKPVFMICHGPQLLITADVLRGRRATGYISIVQDLKNAGVQYEDSDVVVDGSLVSSRHPGDIPAFIRESLKKLG